MLNRLAGGSVSLARVLAITTPVFALVRRHWIMVGLLIAGAALRVLTQLAYWPVIFYPDSFRYLDGAVSLHPSRNGLAGYSIFIRPMTELGSLALLPAANHLLGLLSAMGIYAILTRRGVWRWVAALATVPVLFDGYQLQIEQMIMSEPLFQTVLVAGFAVLTWHREPKPLAIVAGGLLLGIAMWIRLIGLPMIVPAVVYLLLAGATWRRRAMCAGLCTVAFAAPLGGYGVWYALADNGTANQPDRSEPNYTARYAASLLLYARVAPIAQCARLDLPTYAEPLCPRRPPGQRPSEDHYFWHGPVSWYQPPSGRSTPEVLDDFVLRVLTRQPTSVITAITGDFLKFFAWEKQTYGNDLPASRWQFRLDYPVYVDAQLSEAIGGSGEYRTVINGDLARLLRQYQLGIGYTPGPALLVAALLGAVGAVGMGRARERELRAACLVWTTAGIGVLLITTLHVFSWRYQLPALVLLPVAGGLGAAAMVRGGHEMASRWMDAEPPIGNRPLDRLIGAANRTESRVEGRSA